MARLRERIVGSEFARVDDQRRACEQRPRQVADIVDDVGKIVGRPVDVALARLRERDEPGLAHRIDIVGDHRLADSAALGERGHVETVRMPDEIDDAVCGADFQQNGGTRE